MALVTANRCFRELTLRLKLNTLYNIKCESEWGRTFLPNAEHRENNYIEDNAKWSYLLGSFHELWGMMQTTVASLSKLSRPLERKQFGQILKYFALLQFPMFEVQKEKTNIICWKIANRPQFCQLTKLFWEPLLSYFVEFSATWQQCGRLGSL